MIRRNLLALALLALCACDAGVGPPLPETQPGAQAPSRQTRVNAPQANLSADDYQDLNYLVGSRVHEAYRVWAPGFAEIAGGAGGVVEAPVQPGTDYRSTIDLSGGVAYRIVTACDNECDDLDLELIDVRTGGVVADDMGRDGGHRPIVDYTPARDGAHIVRLLLQACSVAPCYVGAKVVAFDMRPPSFENVALPAAVPPGPETDEQRLGPILDYLQERYAQSFNLQLNSAARIRAGEEVRTELRADAQEPLAILGACDGCSNLELSVIDRASGAVVASETAVNNHPVVYYLPTADAALSVRLLMHDCADACTAGVRIRTGDVVLTRD